jgi:hypothetical protein
MAEIEHVWVTNVIAVAEPEEDSAISAIDFSNADPTQYTTWHLHDKLPSQPKRADD